MALGFNLHLPVGTSCSASESSGADFKDNTKDIDEYIYIYLYLYMQNIYTYMNIFKVCMVIM